MSRYVIIMNGSGVLLTDKQHVFRSVAEAKEAMQPSFDSIMEYEICELRPVCQTSGDPNWVEVTNE